MNYGFEQLEKFRNGLKCNQSKKLLTSFYVSVRSLATLENHKELFLYSISFILNPYNRYLFANTYYIHLKNNFKSLNIAWLKSEVDRLSQEANNYRPKPFSIKAKRAFATGKISKKANFFESSNKLNTKSISIAKRD